MVDKARSSIMGLIDLLHRIFIGRASDSMSVE